MKILENDPNETKSRDEYKYQFFFPRKGLFSFLGFGGGREEEGWPLRTKNSLTFVMITIV